MRIDITYTASSGHVYHLQATGMRVQNANFHAWEWSAVGESLERGLNLKMFRRNAATYEVTLCLGGALSARKALIETLHEEWEADVRNMTPGRITWGDYYIDCYIIKSSTYPDQKGWYTTNNILVYAPYPFWISPITYNLSIGDEFTPDVDFDSDYTMKIYGPISMGPNVILMGRKDVFNSFTDDLSLASDEYIIVDTREKTTIKYSSGGTTENVFKYRGHLWDTFAKFPGRMGETRYWNNYHGADIEITIYRERSEPIWT